MAAPKYPERTEKIVYWYMGQEGEGRQGNQAYARSEVRFRRRSNQQYDKQDRAYMRLDKRQPGFAFGSPASHRCAAGTHHNFQSVIFESTVLSNFREYGTLCITFFICVVYII